jgi:hypothetical protein
MAKEWLAEREAELLPAPYYHVVFTLPAPIGDRNVNSGFKKIKIVDFEHYSLPLWLFSKCPSSLDAALFFSRLAAARSSTALILSLVIATPAIDLASLMTDIDSDFSRFGNPHFYESNPEAVGNSPNRGQAHSKSIRFKSSISSDNVPSAVTSP